MSIDGVKGEFLTSKQSHRLCLILKVRLYTGVKENLAQVMEIVFEIVKSRLGKEKIRLQPFLAFPLNFYFHRLW